MHTGDLFDFGPQADAGILTTLPPKMMGSPYPAFVPRADADGNTVAGIRLPDIDVPVATYAGWNLRKNPSEDGCDHAGSVIPFAKTKAERMAKNDPRLSIEERYASHEAYVAAVRKAAADAVKPAVSAEGGCGSVCRGGGGERREEVNEAVGRPHSTR